MSILGRFRARPSRTSHDEGFTLVELMTAGAVFSILMGFTGVAIMNGLHDIMGITQKSDRVAQAQSAMEWISRQAQFMEAPEGVATAIAQASAKEITFYTYAGDAAKSDVPYKVRLFTTTTGGTEANVCSVLTTYVPAKPKYRNLCATVTTPTRIAGGWTWNLTPKTRSLLQVPYAASGNGTKNPLQFSIWYNEPTSELTVPPAPVNLTPVTLGAPAPTAMQVPDYAVFQVGDFADPHNLLTQQVKLVNCNVPTEC